jgi:hypothetical protein
VTLWSVAGVGACPARQEEECLASLRREVKLRQDQRRSCRMQQADRVLWYQYAVLSSGAEADTGPGLVEQHKSLRRGELGCICREAVLVDLCWSPGLIAFVWELQA